MEERAFDSQARQSQFKKLAAQWSADTRHSSSIARMIHHPAYEEICNMGAAAIPLILKELEERPDYWFAALQRLTGLKMPSSGGQFDKERAEWLDWGRQNGHLS